MALRYCLAVPLLFVWLHFAEGVRVPPRSEWRALAVMGVTSVVLYQIGFIFGMRETAASDASLVIALNPVMVALLSVPLLGYRLTRNASIGLASGFAGVALIFLRNAGSHFSSHSPSASSATSASATSVARAVALQLDNRASCVLFDWEVVVISRCGSSVNAAARCIDCIGDVFFVGVL
jgi:drug/metabolite transporter (DMT)-like permease